MRLAGFPFAAWSGSLRAKLVLAFMLVSILPMLAATELATRLVVATFEYNVKTWLTESSSFFFGNILDERRELIGVGDALVAEGGPESLVRAAAGNGQAELPHFAETLLNALGYDYLAVYDEAGAPVFKSRDVGAIQEISLGESNTIYTVSFGGKPLLMAAGTRPFVVDGKRYFLMLGIFIDENYIRNTASLQSFEMRLYARAGADYRMLYDSAQSGTIGEVPPEVVRALAAGEPSVFRRGQGDGAFMGVYTPLLASGHDLIGIVYCGLRSGEGPTRWMNRTNVFAGIFVVGAILAIIGALIVSRHLTRPVLKLAKGVRAVSQGDYGQRIPVHGSDEVAELSEAFNSMTEQLGRMREMEAKLRRQERLSTLGEVAAGLAHEIRNPLGIIKTTAELLQRSERLTEAEVRRLGYVVEEVRRIDRLVKDFLAFAKPPQQLVRLDPAGVVSRAIDFCAQEAERRNIRVSLWPAAEPAEILADPDQFYEAVLNLVLNAMEAMEQGGRLDIRMRRDGPMLRITFTDTGPGVSPEIAARIFDPFVTSKATGTGLGLAKVFAVMESHNGRVEHRNAPQSGAQFDLVLPVAA
jgi:signal transduction histidine kinase